MPELFGVVKLLFFLLIGLFIVDITLLFRSKIGLQAERVVPNKLSNGDENEIKIKVLNRFQFKVAVKIIDELPIQWQVRDFNRSEEHTSELQSRPHLVCRLLLEK